MKILYMEDTEILRVAIGRMIHLLGHDVILAKDGREGLDLARPDIDLVLIDIAMPDLNGIDVLHLLKARSFSSPILAFSAHAAAQHRDYFLGEGFDDYFEKPVKFEGLKLILDKYAALITP